MSKILLLSLVLIMSGCGTPSSENRIGFEEARRMFAERGVQPGQLLPAFDVVDLEGAPVSIRQAQGDRPMVLVTASLTCNVARRQQPQVDQIRDHFGNRLAVVVLYTIDAHPSKDPCPYTGEEWVPPDNQRDNVLVRQPIDLAQRLALAKDFQRRFSNGATIVVDGMDDAGWKALGQAPNLGLLIDANGMVCERQGWFDAKAMTNAVAAMLGDRVSPG